MPMASVNIVSIRRPCSSPRIWVRFEVERTQLEPYEGTVVNLNALSRSVPTPIESLQHPLSSYDALVVSQ